MTKYSKFNIIYRLQKWLDSVPGQTFMNYAYSWGASIVILGTLFKLTHLPGANLMLFIGMGTEVFVFFIAAFDRPFDKTADGMDLPTHVDGENVEMRTERSSWREMLVVPLPQTELLERMWQPVVLRLLVASLAVVSSAAVSLVALLSSQSCPRLMQRKWKRLRLVMWSS